MVPRDDMLFADLEALYDELPRVQCRQCGQCCVSPTCTLAEFLYLIHRAQQTQPAADFERAVLSVPEVHTGYEGNLQCAFLHDSRCMIHPGRTGACRLFGISALNEMGISDIAACKNAVAAEGRTDKAFIEGWLDRLVLLNRGLHPVAEAPFYLTGLSIACWLDIYFEERHRQDFFGAIQTVMKQYVDLSAYSGRRRSKTDILDKIDKVAAFNDFMDLVPAQTLADILSSILKDYPLTGTWYQTEGHRFLAAIEQSMLEAKNGGDTEG